MPQDRLKWIDNVKGIAMVSVVLCHVVDGFYGANLYPEWNRLLFDIRNICNTFQMPLFCMASGVLFSKAYMSSNGKIKKDRLIRQIKSLLSIYVLWCFIMGIFKIMLRGRVNYEVRWIDLLLIWFKPIGVYWYLYVLVGLYVIFAYRDNIRIDRHMLTVILTSISLLASLFVNHEGYLYAFRRIAYFGIVFYIGILMEREDNKNSLKRIGFVLFLVSIIICVFFWSEDKEIYHIPVVNLVAALGFCLIIVYLFQRISERLNFRLLGMVGKNSLDIYLLHVFLTAGCRMVIGKMNEISVWMSIIIVFIIALFVPILIGYIAKRLKIYDLFFKPYVFIERKRKRVNS